MTNEEAKTFLDNLKVCVEEHPIVADWLVEIADRKTENSSEKPNICVDEFFREPTAEERKAVADYIDSISVSTGVNIFDLMDEPTRSKMEQVDKDINVRSKDEPQTERSE